MKLRYIIIALLLFPQIAQANCWERAKVASSQLEEAVRAHETTKQALITIRRNAQDWKNLLLRGNVEKDKEIFLKRFEEQKTAYQKELAKLKSQLIAMNTGMSSINLLEEENKKLFSQYQDAYLKYGVDTLSAGAAADRQAQGGDVRTFRTLEELDAQLAILVKQHFAELKEALNDCLK
jgi:hypothetical protein